MEEKITVLINGQPYVTYPIGTRLMQKSSSWMRLTRSMDPPELFANRLRVTQVRPGKYEDEYVAGATTVFKNPGIFRPGKAARWTAPRLSGRYTIRLALALMVTLVRISRSSGSL